MGVIQGDTRSLDYSTNNKGDEGSGFRVQIMIPRRP